MENSETVIQHISTLVDTEHMRVAEFKIAPKQGGPYHFHTHVVEHCVCLEGTVHMEVSNLPDCLLKPGDRIEIRAGMVHRVINPDTTPCRYLVVQEPGVYDFIEQ